MSERVRLTFETKQTVMKHTTESSVSAFADFDYTGDGFTAVYKDTSLTGYEGCTTTIKAHGNELVEIERSGASGTSIIVDPKKDCHCIYGTDFGTLDIVVRGESIENNITAEGGDLRMVYSIDSGFNTFVDIELNLNIRLRKH